MVKEKIKTYKDWNESLDTYLKIGDLVDYELMAYFIHEVPCVTNTNKLIQMGEAYSHIFIGDKKKATYPTLHKHNGGWRYAGHCVKGETKDRG